MNTTSTLDAPDQAAEIETAVTRTLAQISQIREMMRADELVIAEIKAENAVLKAEAWALRDETRTIIAGLRNAI